MKFFIFALIIFIPAISQANETQCTYIEGNTYWEESVSKCRMNCVFNYRHEIKVYMGGENNLGSVTGSSSTDFALSDTKFDDKMIKDDYYTLFKGKKIEDNIYEVCAMKKSDAYKKQKERLEAEEKMKYDLKSIPNFFKDLFLGGLM
ncbi:hypothetical protein [Candidatus Ulvibacter alkanivorans]|uniref:hypothetical protein n=1 Tax=Candidatus Ulvibacter alkanivorans TaxID=2267620 RepID=UPI000DF34703|nr:hypothetical protein [Candidatus Ulvibacter alkanivorans]